MSESELARIIGKSIDSLLISSGMKQNELAEILKVSESTVGKWVLGKSIPRMGTIQQIADYFGVDKSDILNGKTDIISDNKDYNEDQKWALDASKDPKVSKQLRDIWKAIHGDEHNHF